MENNSAIFVFTKDRPYSLSKTIDSISILEIQIYLIDDSYHLKNRFANQRLIKDITNVSYLGKNEFDNFIKSNNINKSDKTFRIKSPGKKHWNLGNVRNFALIYGIHRGLERALFIDDDIIVPDPESIFEVFGHLDNYLFVGAKIAGMEDDSIVGHISSELGLEENYQRMLSGGFMAFNPQEIDIPFTNIYNEDWIWMYFHLQNERFHEYGSVIQSQYDPYKRYKNKIIFQEFGEIVIDGILKIENNCIWNSFVNYSFWSEVLEERVKYINSLADLCRINEYYKYSEMLEWLQSKTGIYDCHLFQNYFENFKSEIAGFHNLLMLPIKSENKLQENNHIK